jgi:hypothetical protein
MTHGTRHFPTYSFGDRTLCMPICSDEITCAEITLRMAFRLGTVSSGGDFVLVALKHMAVLQEGVYIINRGGS